MAVFFALSEVFYAHNHSPPLGSQFGTLGEE